MAQRQFRSDDTSRWPYRFGRHIEGDVTISSNTTLSPANAGLSATANSGQKNVGVDSASSFANGQLVVIHQSRGSGVGNWELNRIASGGGTTSLVMEMDLINTYTESGNSQAQVMELKEYANLTIQASYTLNAPAWDGSKGGILAIMVNGELSVAGNISMVGRGYRGGDYDTNLGGWGGRAGEGNAGYSGRGGWTGSSENGASPSGGGYGDSSSFGTGASGATDYTGGGGGGGGEGNGGDEGAGGGGGGGNYYGGGGGGTANDNSSGTPPAGDGGTSTAVGGGHGGSGTQAAGGNSGGASSNVSGNGGNGQSGAGTNGGGGGGGANAPYSNQQLTKIYFGGGGGSGGNYAISNQRGGNGGDGSGIMFIFAKVITVTGTVNNDGVAGESAPGRGGSGGAGAAGDTLFKCLVGTFGSNKCTALGKGGGGHTFSAGGGNSSRGVIHVDYAYTITGTTNPTLDSRQDESLVKGPRGAAVLAGYLTA